MTLPVGSTKWLACSPSRGRIAFAFTPTSAATTLRELPRSVAEIFAANGLAGLEQLPGVGLSIARAIRTLLMHGRFGMLERLRGGHDPVVLLQSVPGIGTKLAWRLHEELNVESLADLEAAAHDGRLANFVGAKRLAGIRDSLAQRLDRLREPSGGSSSNDPSVAELLAVDAEYRRCVAAGTVRKIAPHRFNPTRAVWLPVLHTTHGPRHYTAMFSNTARAHRLGKTNDWVVIAYDGARGESQSTIITAQFGELKDCRIVRGRERECEEHYATTGHAAVVGRPIPERTQGGAPQSGTAPDTPATIAHGQPRQCGEARWWHTIAEKGGKTDADPSARNAPRLIGNAWRPDLPIALRAVEGASARGGVFSDAGRHAHGNTSRFCACSPFLRSISRC